LDGDIFDGDGAAEDSDDLLEDDDEEEEEGDGEEDTAGDQFEEGSDGFVSHTALESHNFEASHMRLASKSVPLPLDGALCTMRIYASLRYDDNIIIRCTSIEDSSVVLALRQISIDQVYDIVRSDLHKEHTSEDYHNLRHKLSRMFRESDTENRGYLTYAEFEKLMDKINIGISAQELRYVISEADENENGYVDYEEFIPLAVDMIITYDAYVQAEENQKLQEISIDDEVLHQLSQSNLDRIIDEAHRLIQESDSRSSGSIRPIELKRILRSLIGDKQSEINDESIVAVCQALKKDPFGRLIYSSFPEIMRSVCFTILKLRLIRSQGTEVQNYLMDLFEDTERKAFTDESEGSVGKSGGFILTGYLPLRQILDLMASSKRLSLSRLQVMVIAAPSESEDGLVDYRRFVPTAAKAIDIMFQPSILRRRAELIETQDLSPASLLTAPKDEYLRKLRTLFNAYDLNKSGELNPRQFRAVVEAMDFHLAPSEIMVLMSNADLDSNGAISFEEFLEFCNINLAHLERENHIRQLQEAMNRTDSSNDAEDIVAMTEHLHHIFRLADSDGSGALSYEELEVVFKSVNMHLSHFQLQVLMSEMDVNNDGSVSYDEFVAPLADLLLAYKAKNHAIEEKNRREAWALQKANESSPAWMIDVRKTVSFLYDKLQLVHDTIEDPIGRRNAVVEVLRHPNAGLNRTEANMLLARLYPHKGSLDSAVDLSAHTSASNSLILNLENILSDIRRTTIMRGFIEDLPASSVAAHLQSVFNAELGRLHEAAKLKDGDAFVSSTSLPLSTVFGLLERNTMVRLNRTQILGILSWADCFEEGSSSEINCKRFARYAADVITKLNSPDQMLRRASVVKHAAFEMNNLLNGATQAEIESYLTDAFTKLQKETKVLDEFQVTSVIRNMPKVNLSDKEASTLFATIPKNPDKGFQWKQFVPCAYLATADICRERMISRRLTLMGAAEMNAEDRLALQKLAERLAPLVTLRRYKGRLRIVLPSDDPSLVKKSSLLQVKERRRTRLLSASSSVASVESGAEEDAADNESSAPGSAKRQMNLTKSPSKIEGSVDAENSLDSIASSQGSKGGQSFYEKDIVSGRTKAYARSHASSAPDSYDIVRVGKRVPVITINLPGESVEDRMNEIIGGGRIRGESLLLLIKFMENDPLLNPDAAPLKILALSADGSQKFNLPVTLRLPSVGMVDGEAAKHFARNIIDKLYVERFRRKITLRIYDKKEVI
jgi:Ca2+-binding EF-hand superfamily protein